MIPTLAETALWLALPISVWGCVLAFLGGTWGRGDLVLSAERSVHVVFALLIVACGGLAFAFLTDRFEYAPVYAHSSLNLDPALKIAALWAGGGGFLLFWGLNLAFLSALAVWLNRRRNRALMPWVSGVLLGFLFFLVLLTLFVSPPFERLDVLPDHGHGLDPRLQSYWMMIHPPILYLGLTAFAVPFAFGIAALTTGRLGAGWSGPAREWILVGWFLVTIGIILGMRWAYEDPARAEIWSREEMRNAALLVWLVATVLIHSLRVEERRGIGKLWNMGLLCLVFLVSVFATVLAPSHLAGSAAFSPEIPATFLGFIGMTGSVCLILILWRFPLLRSGVRGARRGRGGEAVPGQQAIPGQGSVRGEPDVVREGAVVGAGEVSDPSSRASGRDRSRWAGHIVHAGVVVVLAGVAGSAFGAEVRQSLDPGESVSVRSLFGHEYTLTYQGLSTHQGRNMWQVIALLTVSRNGEARDAITTELQYIHAPPHSRTTSGIGSTLLEDLYVVLDGLERELGPGGQPEDQLATFRVTVNPLGSWIWYGGLIIAAGSLVGLWPGSAPSGAVLRTTPPGRREGRPTEDAR